MLSDVSPAHAWICLAESLNTASTPPAACSRSDAAATAFAANAVIPAAAPTAAPIFANFAPNDSKSPPALSRPAAACAASTRILTDRTADFPAMSIPLGCALLVNVEDGGDHIVGLRHQHRRGGPHRD